MTMKAFSFLKLLNRASLNDNADATIEGVEAEFTFFLSSTIMIDGFRFKNRVQRLMTFKL